MTKIKQAKASYKIADAHKVQLAKNNTLRIIGFNNSFNCGNLKVSNLK